MSNWNNMNRADKIKDLFKCTESEFNVRVKELWGEEAQTYSYDITFPVSAPWAEIAEVIRMRRAYHMVHIVLTEDDFMYYVEDEIPKKLYDENGRLKKPLKSYRKTSDSVEYKAYKDWRSMMLRNRRPKRLDVRLYDENTLISRMCTLEGGRGDEDGFGVEPDMWASALIDFNGRVVRPFSPGYMKTPSDRYCAAGCL